MRNALLSIIFVRGNSKLPNAVEPRKKKDLMKIISFFDFFKMIVFQRHKKSNNFMYNHVMPHMTVAAKTPW